LETVTVYYRWHPLSGLALPVRRRQQDRNGERLLCQAPDGKLLSLPSWMCDPDCIRFSIGPPLISTDALGQLRALLDMCQASSNHVSDKEDVDETSSQAKRGTVEPAPFSTAQ
jgi:hypothetical protein